MHDIATLGGVKGWHPLQLSPALWLDGAEPGTLWQDSAGTLAAELDGDPVGRWGSASQSLAARRPTLRIAAGLRWLDFDGSDDVLDGGAINGALREVHIAARFLSAGSTRALYGAAPSPGNRSWFGITSTGRLTGSTGAWAGGTFQHAALDLTGLDRVVGFVHDGTTARLFINGVEVASMAQAAGTISGAASHIGAANGPSPAHSPVRIYGLCDMPRLLTGAERAALVTVLGARAGLVV